MADKITITVSRLEDGRISLEITEDGRIRESTTPTLEHARAIVAHGGGLAVRVAALDYFLGGLVGEVPPDAPARPVKPMVQTPVPGIYRLRHPPRRHC